MSRRRVDESQEPATAELLAKLLPAGHECREIARIRATVDRERAASELRLPIEDRLRDPLLGASVGVIRPAGGDAVALLEPDREGRLAARLARHGEQWAGSYVEAAEGLDAVVARAARAAISLSRPAVGPFGRSVLVMGGRPGDPYLILVDRPAGTIGR